MRIPIFCFILSLLVVTSCKKKEDESAPHLNTNEPYEITSYSMLLGGSEIDNGPILDKGICWSNDHIPGISDDHASAGEGADNFKLKIDNLDANMNYYIRAYATNKYRTGYGKVIRFQTSQPPVLPTLQTINATSVTQSSVVCGGFLQSTTNKPIISIGLCWSTNTKPKITDQVKTYTASVFTGYTYSMVISGLSNNTTYYVRAYATTADGTGYGNEIKFKTTYGSVADYNGNVYGTVMIGGKVWMTENLRVNCFNDGTSIPLISNNTAWPSLTTPGSCNFNSAATTFTPYGKLYNWYCVNNSKNIAPVGWHVANSSDWEALENELGSNVALKLKIQSSQYWNTGGGTNESGFSAIGCGYCDQSRSFMDQSYSTYYWTSGTSSYSKYLDAYTNFTTQYTQSNYGLSIRCVKN